MLALVVTVPAGEAELASDMLWSLGVLAVEEREPDSGTADHLVELWTSLGNDVDSVTHAAEGYPKRWRWHLANVDETVADSWRQHAVATWVESDLVIAPAWVPINADRGVTVIRIEPGATFGLGDHPTTVLSLRALRTAMFPGATVLDVGCGSGVLSVAACRFGAGRVDAIDISTAAPPVTLANAELNEVGGRITASTTPLAEVDGQYDVVVANILAPALIDLGNDLRRVVKPGGVLIVSGLLVDNHAHVRAALAPMQLVGEEQRDGWTALTLRW